MLNNIHILISNLSENAILLIVNLEEAGIEAFFHLENLF